MLYCCALMSRYDKVCFLLHTLPSFMIWNCKWVSVQVYEDMCRYIMYASGIWLISFDHVFWISLFCASSERQANNWVSSIKISVHDTHCSDDISFSSVFCQRPECFFCSCSSGRNTKEAYGRLSLSGHQPHVRRKFTYKVIKSLNFYSWHPTYWDIRSIPLWCLKLLCKKKKLICSDCSMLWFKLNVSTEESTRIMDKKQLCKSHFIEKLIIYQLVSDLKFYCNSENLSRTLNCLKSSLSVLSFLQQLLAIFKCCLCSFPGYTVWKIER